VGFTNLVSELSIDQWDLKIWYQNFP